MVDRLGKYEIIRTLGHGAMGEVYLAHHPVIGREVAIKTILQTATRGEDAEARFRREATAAGKLNHPNLVTIFDFDKDGDVLYLVMEYVKGEDLEELIRERDLTQSQFLEVLAQVCDGLAYAHKAGIIHRDIKPANVRIVRDGKRLLAKVMDFGIARTEDSNMTSTGIVMGTVSYMAPEYIQSGKATVQADLWATGVMLYECLAGRKPFHGDNTTTVLFKIVSETPRPLEPTEIHGISPSVRYVLERALAKDPSKRFFSAEEFAKALRACKDPSWTGTVEEATSVIARHQAAQAAADAAGVLPSGMIPAMAAPETASVPQVQAATPTAMVPAAPPTAMVPAPQPMPGTVVLPPVAQEPGTVMLGSGSVQPEPGTVMLPPSVEPGTVLLGAGGVPSAGLPGTHTPPMPPPVPAMAQATGPAVAKPSRTGLYVGGGAAAVALLAGGIFLATRKRGEAPPAAPAPGQVQAEPAAQPPTLTAASGGSPQAPAPGAPQAAGVPAATTKATGPEVGKLEVAKTQAVPQPGMTTQPAPVAPKPEPAKPEPPKAETPEDRFAKAVALIGSEPKVAAQQLKVLAYTAPTSQDAKVHGAYLAALYQARSLAEFERAYDNALRNGFGPNRLNDFQGYRKLFNSELVALKEKKEGVLSRDMTLKMFNDFSNKK